MLKIQRFEVNPVQENCYVVSDETREAAVIDCGVFFGVHKEMETTPDCHRNIVFSGCRFRGARATLDVRCCRGLTLDGNTFDLPPDKAIRLVHVADVVPQVGSSPSAP